MGTNKSNHRLSVADRRRARQELKALLQAAKIERATQAEILEDLKRKYRGDIPVPVIWDFMADRRIQAAETVRGISGGAT